MIGMQMERWNWGIPFLPWQKVLLTWMGGLGILLFCAICVLMLVAPKKKISGQHDLDRVICFLILGLFLVFGVLMLTVGVFAVAVELGWQLSILTTAFSLIGLLSLRAALVGSISKRQSISKTTFWLSFGAFAFMMVFILVLVSSQHAIGAVGPW